MKAAFAQDSIDTDEWMRMISSFSRTQLTVSDDVLPALSGIANRVQYSGEYYAGMWEHGFARLLLWYSSVEKINGEDLSPKSPSTYLAPSFAWPSVIGAKGFIYCGDDAKPSASQRIDHHVTASALVSSKRLTQVFELLSISCTPRSSNPLGALQEGELRIVASFLNATFVNWFDMAKPSSTFIEHAHMPSYCLWATLRCENGEHLIYHPDTTVGLLQGERLMCVRLFADTRGYVGYGLVLKHERHTNRYRRVGFIATLYNRLFDSHDGFQLKADITIV